MRKFAILLILAALFMGVCFASAPLDSSSPKTAIFKTDIYTSYYNYQTHCPDSIVYKLYKGGGKCSRDNMHFMADSGTARLKDYINSHYDKGHLCPAEDFAYECALEHETFRFINCIPQPHSFNAGIWKTYETKARKASQTDSLLISCGPIFSANPKHIGPDNVAVPDSCWKRAISLTTHQTIFFIKLPNN